MSQVKVYLCPSCQSVVKSENGSVAGLVCEECDFKFSGKGEAKGGEKLPDLQIARPPAQKVASSGSIARDVMKKRQDSPARVPVIQSSSVHEMVLKEGTVLEHHELPPGEDEVILKDGRRIVRRKKRKKDKEKHRKLYFFLTLWLGIAAAILAVVQMNKDPEGDQKSAVEDQKLLDERRDELFIREHFPAISMNFSKFMRSTEDADRIQEIDYSSRMASKFARFHQAQSLPEIKGRLGAFRRNVIELQKEPFAPAVEVVWKDEAGSFFESVHVWDGMTWKLDWEHFAKFSTTPWTLFRSKLGPKEGEFRLLMRKRETLRESTYFSLLFYEEPAFGVEDQRKALQASESEEVIVKVRSDLGRQLTELFKNKEDGLKPYESIFGELDPNTMLRVSAVLAWEEDEDGDEILVLKQLPGVSWYGSRVRMAYRAEKKSQEENSNDSVFPSGAKKKGPIKE